MSKRVKNGPNYFHCSEMTLADVSGVGIKSWRLIYEAGPVIGQNLEAFVSVKVRGH